MCTSLTPPGLTMVVLWVLGFREHPHVQKKPVVMPARLTSDSQAIARIKHIVSNSA